MKTFFKILFLFPILPILLIVTFFLGSNLLLDLVNFEENHGVFSVEGEPTRWFPVAMSRIDNKTNRDVVDIVFWGDLKEYQSQYPQASYELPHTNIEKINDEIMLRCRELIVFPSQLNGNCFNQGFEILSNSSVEGSVPTQVKVTYETSHDYINNSWYSIDGDTIRPIKHQHYFGPGAVMGFAMASIAAAILVYVIIVVAVIYRVYRRWHRNRHRNNE